MHHSLNMHFMHYSMHSCLYSQLSVLILLLNFTYSAYSRSWATVKYISYSIYIDRRLINAMIQLVIIYSDMIRVDT